MFQLLQRSSLPNFLRGAWIQALLMFTIGLLSVIALPLMAQSTLSSPDASSFQLQQGDLTELTTMAMNSSPSLTHQEPNFYQ
jgi:Tfp pilus assembly protein PilV